MVMNCKMSGLKKRATFSLNLWQIGQKSTLSQEIESYLTFEISKQIIILFYSVD